MFLQSFRPAGEKNGNGQADAMMHGETVESEFQRLKTGIHRELLDSLDLSRLAGLSDEELREDIRRLAETMLRTRSRKLPAIDEERLVEELIAESFGLGPLEVYMQDPDVTDILVNGPHEVYVERLGRLQETNTVFADEEHLLQIIQRVVARVGRRIDEHSPMCDARLPDGSRVNAIIPPLALGGPVLSIRRFGHRPLQVNDLLTRGSICPEMLELLEAAIEGRINIMISGGTGSGKTTMLNNLSRFIPGGERLVTIEDSAELLLQRKHVVKLETRPKSAEGASEISQRDLVRNALRMRPDRIILGEVRGGEALDMLQAMNTGHEGSMSTIHANDTRDALSRLEVMVSMAGFDLPVPVVRRYIASAVTLVVHLSRLKGGVRRVMRISEITALESGDYVIQDLFGFQQSGIDDRGIARGHFYATGIKPNFAKRLKEVGIELSDKLFTQRALTGEIATGPVSNIDAIASGNRFLQEDLA
ncbi:type II secretion system protein E [Pirellula staleyi DSM 6068]|uniref:Type II secretion system protein E n=1 Tax=Pirellula staleyi (strain ATCC 27377 / DSM 6068 / ICPB 4128) TaxID=530564 RepID=D2R8E4_PIRSD|nr:CpaF family protein [Pirellula staleyi]ADB15761.1 type II secretion system protein E [Pirellula staleyi DSM 6068]